MNRCHDLIRTKKECKANLARRIIYQECKANLARRIIYQECKANLARILVGVIPCGYPPAHHPSIYIRD